VSTPRERAPTPALRELQAELGQALLAGSDGGARSGGAGIAVETVAADGLRPEARLRIYRHHVFTTLTEALRSTFPVVCRLVDERFFAYAADRFIAGTPPAAPCLFEYGAAFPDFLAAFPPCRHLEYLPDVARLEWAMNVALNADDAAPLDPAALGAVPAANAGRLVLHFHPSIALLESPWPLDRLWTANQPESDPEEVVDLGAGGVRLEIRRRGDDVVWRTLDPATFAFRRALADGRPLEEAAGAALAVDAGFDLAAGLHDLLLEEAVVGWALPPLTMEMEQ
jgi:hypothetical protein